MAKKKSERREETAPSAEKGTKSAAKKSTSRAAAGRSATPKKSAAKKAASKSAPKKSATKKAAAKKATTATKSTAKKAAKATKNSARKGTSRGKKGTPAPLPAVESSADGGIIRPASKRPAQVHPINGALLYRQQRDSTVEPELAAPDIENVEVPESYGVTRLSALVRDAEWIFTYWDFSAETRRRFDLDDREVSRALALRLYDVTGITFDGTNARSFTDVPVNTIASSWYLHVPESGRRYVVEIGLLDNNGFRAIARSNEVDMPTNAIAESADWDATPEQEEAHRQILLLSGGPNIPAGLSSAEFATSWNARFFEESAGFSGVLFSGTLGGASELTSRAAALQPPRDRGFWLKVDAEVIVYGATDPKAKVRFMGREVRLGPDGTFGIRMALPDGKIEFPVEATSPDEQETRSVCPIVTRRTS